MISTAVDAFTSEWFLRGLLFGLGGFGLGLVVALGWRGSRRLPQPAPIAGGLITVAALLAMPVIRSIPIELWQAVGMLAAGGLLFPWARKVPVLPAVLAVPGGWWLAQRVELPGAAWVPWFLAVAVVVGAPLAASFDRRHPDRGWGPLFMAVTVAGAFATLPDTEEVLVLLGATVPLALLAWPKALASLGAWGIYPLVGVLAWVSAWGGRGREGAVVGAVAGLGLLLAEPIARAVRTRTLLDRLPARWWVAPAAVLMQVAVVLLTARVAGLRTSPIAAGLVALAALVVAAGVLTMGTASARGGRHRAM